MSAYLSIAEIILRDARRPMTSRAILNEAFRRRMMPSHLYGETQHKTLQARISEDILMRRDHSYFFRTKPGTFFLREFLTDTTIPAEYRQPITAHRRTRDLIRGWPLSVNSSMARQLIKDAASLPAEYFFEKVEAGGIAYLPYRKDPNHAPVWSIGFVRRGNQLLCYRSGRYRDDRRAFAQKQSLTFASLVVESDMTLFDEGKLGIENSALSAISVDLDIPTSYGGKGLSDFVASARFICRDASDLVSDTILAFVEVNPPSWFEPFTNRLSLNDLRWISFSPPPNNIDDFDPWSQFLIAYCSEHHSTVKA